MMKAQAEQRRATAIEAVKEAQAKCSRTIGIDRQRAKAELQVRLEELAAAKAALKRINVESSGLAPIEERPRDLRPPTSDELATVLLETFQRLLILDPTHAAIRTLRAHFETERPNPITVLPDKRLRPAEPLPPVRFLDVDRRRASGPGATLYHKERSSTQ
jgi:hypothetical protein